MNVTVAINLPCPSGGWTWPEVQHGRGKGPITSRYFFTSPFFAKLHALLSTFFRKLLHKISCTFCQDNDSKWKVSYKAFCLLLFIRILVDKCVVIRLPRETVHYGGFCSRFVLDERVRFLIRYGVRFELKNPVNYCGKSCSLVLLAWTRVNLLPFFCYLRLKLGEFWRWTRVS